MFSLLEASANEKFNEFSAKLAAAQAEGIVSDLIDAAIRFGLKLLAAIAIYTIGIWLIRRIKKIIANLMTKKGTDPAMAGFLLSLTNIALMVILILITIGALGIDTTSIAALLAGGGVAIGLALNGTVQNFAGGIMILVFKPFRLGDFIEIEGHSGTVTEIAITTTKLKTPDNRIIIIPNGMLSNETINNYTYATTRRLDINVNVEYGASAEYVKETLTQIISEEQRILTSQTGAPAEPFVALSGMLDSSVQFVIKVWVKSDEYWDINYAILEKIYTTLPEKGISFPYPKLDVNILKDDK